jgi:hypothetical protein
MAGREEIGEALALVHPVPWAERPVTRICGGQAQRLVPARPSSFRRYSSWTRPLPENMMASSEAFLTREGAGMVSLENSFIVRRDGIEMLTRLPMFWW